MKDEVQWAKPMPEKEEEIKDTNPNRVLLKCDEEKWWQYFINKNIKKIPDGKTFIADDLRAVKQGNNLIVDGIPYDAFTIMDRVGEFPEYTLSLLGEIVDYFSDDEEIRDVLLCRVSDDITLEILSDGEICIDGEFITKSYLFNNDVIDNILDRLAVPPSLQQIRKKEMFEYLTGESKVDITNSDLIKALGLTNRKIKGKNAKPVTLDFGDAEMIKTIEDLLKEDCPIIVGDTTFVRKDNKVFIGPFERSNTIPDIFHIYHEKDALDLISGLLHEAHSPEKKSEISVSQLRADYHKLKNKWKFLSELAEEDRKNNKPNWDIAKIKIERMRSQLDGIEEDAKKRNIKL